MEPTVERSLSHKVQTILGDIGDFAYSPDIAASMFLAALPAVGLTLVEVGSEPSPELERLRRIEAAARLYAYLGPCDNYGGPSEQALDALRAALEDEAG